MLHNVHERVVEVPADRLGALLAGLGGPDDRLWPAPVWVPMVLDRPVGVGADGGHGPIRYRVTEYEPGRRVRFGFDPACGLDGYHELELEEAAAGATRVRHTLVCETSGAMRAIAPLLERVHDAVVEDLLDNAEREATGRLVRPARWSLLVRIAHRLTERVAPDAVGVPEDAALARRTIAAYGGEPRVDLLDAWAVPAHRLLPSDPQVWADAVFRSPPRWVAALMGLRQLLVGLVGIERGSARSFATRDRTEHEVLLGEDAGHLDFRASVHVSDRAVTLSTVVRVHNGRGRLYLAPVRVLHPVIVRAMLARAWRRLGQRPAAAPAARGAGVR